MSQENEGIYHRGNATVSSVQEGTSEQPPMLRRSEPLPERFSTSTYLTPHSDIVALTMFDHQMRMMNLITRAGWEARTEATTFKKFINEFVDYLLFIDEAPMTAPLEGSSGFAATFTAQGPFDRRGRSLRQFDLTNRLMRYPCSYMIYSEAFAALPQKAKDAIYERMREVLSGEEKNQTYRRLSAMDRNAILEILEDTGIRLAPALPGQAGQD
jgi:hypothetical protein